MVQFRSVHLPQNGFNPLAQTIIEGLDLDISAEADDEDLNLDDIAQKILDAFNTYQRGAESGNRTNVKAAAAHLVDAVNMVSSRHGVSCGASL